MTIRLGKKLIALRRDANMTQEELAAYMGVSKSSVSKWETETTLPDILLLPQLATLFNVSVDELIGYEPQLSMEAVNKLYLQLSAEWSRDSANAYAHSEELIRKYYSCFPFLLQMAGLYLNHYMLHEKPELVMKRSEELLEAVRSYKLVILLIVFAALGFMNPVSARYLPELVAGFLPEGMHMEIPQPVVLDSWLQFFKNTAQIGLIAIIIMCSSSMANEIGKGVLIPLLAKGMPRNSVLAAKFISISCLWTLSLGCSFLITFLYNFVFWESSLVPHLFPLVTGVWLFGLMMTASMILGGVYKGTVSGSLLCAGCLFLLCVLITMFAAVADYSPFVFLSQYQSYLTDGITMQEFLKPAVCAVTATLLQLAAAVIIFRRKSL